MDPDERVVPGPTMSEARRRRWRFRRFLVDGVVGAFCITFNIPSPDPGSGRARSARRVRLPDSAGPTDGPAARRRPRSGHHP